MGRRVCRVLDGVALSLFVILSQAVFPYDSPVEIRDLVDATAHRFGLLMANARDRPLRRHRAIPRADQQDWSF
jgi:hypothetical protein